MKLEIPLSFLEKIYYFLSSNFRDNVHIQDNYLKEQKIRIDKEMSSVRIQMKKLKEKYGNQC